MLWEWANQKSFEVIIGSHLVIVLVSFFTG